MVNDPDNGSPFHEGERRLQSQAGVRDRMDRIGRQVIRDHMTEEHREFFEQLPFVLVGHVDATGRPWASVLPGCPGFIRCPDAHTLQVETRPVAGDPLLVALQPDKDIGLLGIDLKARRRNRVSARIRSVDSGRMVLSVLQAFGNCPRYIQRRDFRPGSREGDGGISVHSLQRLEGRAREMIATADTFFVASHSGRAGVSASGGADVSHRGGRPGFVRIDGGSGLTVPDYAGNRFFNTLGNFLVNPRAGLLFIDFSNGDILMLSGAVEMLRSPVQVEQFRGAERLWRFTLDQGLLIRHALSLRWGFLDYSPHSLRTGSWAEVDAGNPGDD